MTISPLRHKPSQTSRLVMWLRANPGATSLEITFALSIVNVTGRISDARAQGFTIDCVTDRDGTRRYYLREGVVALELGLGA